MHNVCVRTEGGEQARHGIVRWSSIEGCREPWIIKWESGLSPTAANPTSSAFGLGQLILANRRRYALQVRGRPGGRGPPLRHDRPLRAVADDAAVHRGPLRLD